jgi:hypothetical protein
MKNLMRFFMTTAFVERTVALTVLVLCSLVGAATAVCNDWQPGFELPGFDGPVYALARVGDTIYAGGYFAFVNGVRVNHIAKWDGTSWSPLGTGIDGNVEALAVDGSGNLYAGGEFETAGGVITNNVAKWDGTSWSPLGAGVACPENPYSCSVNALAADGKGDVYAGGMFTAAGGVNANHVAKWDGTSWGPLGTGVASDNPAALAAHVGALLVDSNGNLYAGGDFTTAGGVQATKVAKWDGTSWSPLGGGYGSPYDSDSVNALAVDGSGNVYAGASGSSSYAPAKWDGTSWSPLGTGAWGGLSHVSALALDGSGNLYAGGYFITADSVPVNSVAKWDGTSWSALGENPAGVDGYISALAVDGSGNLYAGGDFGTAGGVDANRLAKWDGTSWSAVGQRAANGVRGNMGALAADSSGNVYTAGGYGAGGSLARWNGTKWSALGTGVSEGGVGALALDGNGEVYAAGGYIDNLGAWVAKWNGTTWDAPLWEGIVYYSPGPRVEALAVGGGGTLYAGGRFDSANGVLARNVARWDGTNWTALGTGIYTENPDYMPVNALAADAYGNLYAGGYFKTAGGVAANSIAKWDGVSWSPLGTGVEYPEGFLGRIEALAVDGRGNLYAGGLFSRAGGVDATSVAKWDGTSWSPLGAGVRVGESAGVVNVLALDDRGAVYVAGIFTTAGDVSVNNIAKWDGTNWSALGAGMGDGTVYGLAVDRSGNLYAGGYFSTAGTIASSNFAKFEPCAIAVCVGDCDGNSRVTIDEILTLVNIALGNAAMADCDPGDARGDGQITVDEILAAVNCALNGCESPTNTPTPPPTSTSGCSYRGAHMGPAIAGCDG